MLRDGRRCRNVVTDGLICDEYSHGFFAPVCSSSQRGLFFLAGCCSPLCQLRVAAGGFGLFESGDRIRLVASQAHRLKAPHDAGRPTDALLLLTRASTAATATV